MGTPSGLVDRLKVHMRPRYERSDVEFKKMVTHKGGQPLNLVKFLLKKTNKVLVVLPQLMLFPCLFHNGSEGRLDLLNPQEKK